MRGIVIACAILAFLPSCVAVPTPKHGLAWGHGARRDVDLATLEVGKTGLEEALLRLGPPEISLEDGRILVYDWGLVAGYIAWMIPGTMTEIGSDRALVLEFDDRGRLLRFSRSVDSGWSDPFDQARKQLLAWYPDRARLPKRWTLEVDPLPELWTPVGIGAPSKALTRVRVGTFRDARPAGKDGRTLGEAERIRYLGVVDTRAARPVADMVRAMVARQLASQGFPIEDEQAEAEVSGYVESFAAGQNSVTYTVVVEAVCGTSPPLLQRRYQNTLLRLGSSYDFGARVREALLDLQQQLAADGELARHLRATDRR